MQATADTEELSVSGRDGERIVVRRWLPAGGRARAVVQVAHGAAEHGARYARLGRFLAAAGYAVYADDHRGHGRTAGAPERRGLAGRAGTRVWEAMVDDLGAVAERIRGEHPGAPLFFLGHSMGSLLAQHVAQRAGDALRGLVLSGTFGVVQDLDARIAHMEACAAADADAPSEAFAAMFASFNEPYASAGGALTGFEWLSRDADEVRRYVDDPWCGFPFSNAMAAAVLLGAREAWRPENERRIPRALPVLVVCGADDPAGGNGAAVTPLVDRYRALGIADLTARFYAGARHELLNETNREEVQRDLLAWLEAHA
jgi:alpha-beta hydrolase superfamily lysophospholipase